MKIFTTIALTALLISGCNTQSLQERLANATTLPEVIIAVEGSSTEIFDTKVNETTNTVLIDYKPPVLTTGTVLSAESDIIHMLCRIRELVPDKAQQYRLFIGVVDSLGNLSDIPGLQVRLSADTVNAINCDTKLARLSEIAETYILHRLLQE